MISKDKREVGGWWMWILLLVVASSVILGTLGYMGEFTGTFVERKVLENSIQYSEARKSEIATFEAQLAEIDATLLGMAADDSRRNGLTAQRSAINIQLNSARSRQ